MGRFPADFGDNTQCLLWILEPQVPCLYADSAKASQAPLSPQIPAHMALHTVCGDFIIWGNILFSFAWQTSTVVGSIAAPKEICPHPNPQMVAVILFGKMVLVDVIKLMILR